MPSILLAGDERLPLTLGMPLASLGWSVATVRGLSEVTEAVALSPPDVVILAVPAASGGPAALYELRQSLDAGGRSLVVILPPSRAAEATACREAGASEVVIAPVVFADFLKLVAALAHVEGTSVSPTEPAAHLVAEAPPSASSDPMAEQKAIASEENDQPAETISIESSIVAALSTDWPLGLPTSDAAVAALIAFQLATEIPAGFDRDTLQPIFRALTEIEVKALRAGSEKDRVPVTAETTELRRLSGERVRVSLAAIAAEKIVVLPDRAPVDQEALGLWRVQLDSLTKVVGPIQQRAVATGDLPMMRQCVQLADVVSRLRRDVDEAARKISAAAPIAANAAVTASPAEPGTDRNVVEQTATERVEPAIPATPTRTGTSKTAFVIGGIIIVVALGALAALYFTIHAVQTR